MFVFQKNRVLIKRLNGAFKAYATDQENVYGYILRLAAL